MISLAIISLYFFKVIFQRHKYFQLLEIILKVLYEICSNTILQYIDYSILFIIYIKQNAALLYKMVKYNMLPHFTKYTVLWYLLHKICIFYLYTL